MMKRIMLTLAAMTVTLGASRIWAADQPSGTQPSATQPAADQAPALQPPSAEPSASQPAANTPSMGNSQAAQTPPQNWTSLKGTVMAVDPTAKIVQLKDASTGNLVQVPLTEQVVIKKDGKGVTLSQIKTGDTIKLAKRNPSAQEQVKPSSY